MGYGVYLLFASLMVVSIFFVYVSHQCSFAYTILTLTPGHQFFVPETSHIQLERMDELFSSELKPWKAHAVVIERQRQVQGAPNVAEENASVEQKMVDEDNKERRDHIEYV